MNPSIRDASRVAVILRQCLTTQHQEQTRDRCSRYESIPGLLAGLQHDLSRLRKAARLPRHAARQRLLHRVGHRVDYLRQALRDAERFADDCGNLGTLPSHRHVHDELQQLHEELGEWTFDRSEQTLSATTPPITLEEVYLGPFRIVLMLSRVGERCDTMPFRVVALEPHTPPGSDLVTHPHVSDERLCAGDATIPLRQALQDGRLADFFILVRSVLQHYNPESPYVAIEEWEGTHCHDCGDHVQPDESFHCGYCVHDFCDHCCGRCEGCDDNACDSCLSTCQHCDHSHCTACMSECENCADPCCQDCLGDDLCPTCVQAQEEELDTEPDVEPNEPVTPPHHEQPHAHFPPQAPPPPPPPELPRESAPAAPYSVAAIAAAFPTRAEV